MKRLIFAMLTLFLCGAVSASPPTDNGVGKIKYDVPKGDVKNVAAVTPVVAAAFYEDLQPQITKFKADSFITLAYPDEVVLSTNSGFTIRYEQPPNLAV